MNNQSMLPTARKDNLIVKELQDELLIYDTTENKAFCLNKTAWMIMDQCDGQTTMAEAAKRIGKKLKTDVDEQVFWMALTQLKRNGLLDKSTPIPEIPKVSRRDLVGSTMTLGIALPAIFALGVAPPIVSGQCVETGSSCIGAGTQGNCCGGVCGNFPGSFCCSSPGGVNTPPGSVFGCGLTPGGSCQPCASSCCSGIVEGTNPNCTCA